MRTMPTRLPVFGSPPALDRAMLHAVEDAGVAVATFRKPLEIPR